MQTEAEDPALLEQARAGSRAAFDRLAVSLRPGLRSFIYRMVAQPEDTEDLVQETLLRAYRGLPGFRGASSFRTWVFTIAHRLCIDTLHERRRWPWTAQLEAEVFAKSHAQEVDLIHGSMRTPGFRFEVREHIAFCLACVGRSLPSEQHAALLLSEMFDFKDREGAEILFRTGKRPAAKPDDGARRYSRTVEPHFGSWVSSIPALSPRDYCHRLFGRRGAHPDHPAAAGSKSNIA